jgi:hypothetical protein
MQLVLRFRRCQRAQMGKIAVVHRENQIKGFKVTGMNFPAALSRNIDPVAARNRDRAAIRRIADVPAACSG